MQYSSLDQINKSKVASLELAWFLPVPDRKGNFGFNPIVIDRTMYLMGAGNTIVAVAANSGKILWSHTPDGGTPGYRGISYWESRDRADRRLIFGVGSTLRAIDARTGRPIPSFGERGQVSMRTGPLRPLGGPSSTPVRIFENLAITGSVTGEGYGSPPGDVRAYDVRTGKLVWTFHTIPHPGEFGYDTWPKDAHKWAGGVNAWGEISIDTVRGIAYIPLGSPTFDLFGGDRKGDNLFGNSLVALDVRTGKRLWHFQTVHHDLWDYDLCAAPKLLTIHRDGKALDVVALPTKFGLLYVFDRVTGKPVWPIEERPVPGSDVPGEEASPTQPFPTHLPAFARLKFSSDEINPYVDEPEQQRLHEILQNARHEGIFTPPTLDRDQISMPGENGGTNWGGSAADPTTGWLYIRSADQPEIHRLRVPETGIGGPAELQGRALYRKFCDVCHGEATRTGIQSRDRACVIDLTVLGPDRIRHQIRAGNDQMPPFSEEILSNEQVDMLLKFLANPESAGAVPSTPPTAASEDGVTRYTGVLGILFNARNGLPAIAPPWAELVAYDLNEGVIKWRAPLGTVPGLVAKGITDTGNPYRMRAGPVVTAGGLIFIGTTADGKVWAFDKDTGKILWKRALGANPSGIPAVYEIDGRQYVIFCGSRFDASPGNIAISPGKAEAQGYYAFALPKGHALSRAH